MILLLSLLSPGFGLAVETWNTLWLHDLDLSLMKQGWGRPQVNHSVGGQPLSIAARKFDRGIGTHARSVLWVALDGTTERLIADAGVDDDAGGPGSVNFRVIGDGRKLWESGTMKSGDAPKHVDVALKGVRTLLLQITDAGNGPDYDHADWADARLLYKGAKPRAISRPQAREEAVLLTPKPIPAPRINGPKVYGCRSGNPFIYRVPTQGERPMTFSARNLPACLQLQTDTGIITGSAPPRGVYTVTLRAENRHGQAERQFKIVSGDTLALTPPMGWNHWYVHYDRITDQLMRQAAEAMVTSRMADVGYAYVDIDDCWQNAPKHDDPLRVGPLRDESKRLVPNKYFPDMKALTDFIHSQGLKAGIYSSPGPLTCGGFAGSYQHEALDADQFADWGFDLLKYDWCSYSDIVKSDAGTELEKIKRPYVLMGNLLKGQKRDIHFNLCQYGMGNVSEWGNQVGGHSWRTRGDLGFELDSVMEVALSNARIRAGCRPGAWNDPDYIQIGAVAAFMGQPKPSTLAPSEQYAFLSLWALSAAPLFFSGDMAQLDDFTLNVLCNPEVIEIDQDPLGLCAEVIQLSDDAFLMVRKLEDGSRAVGLCNLSEFPAEIVARWSDVGVSGKQKVRDVWRQKDIGVLAEQFTSQVPPRGVTLITLAKAERLGEIKKSSKHEQSWNELAEQYTCPEWFRDAKFGIWAHWGPQAVPSSGGGWYARHMYMTDVGNQPWGKNAYPHHCATYGHPSEFGFKDVINLWKAEKFNAEVIVRQAKRWGARYFVALAAHHDHFDCFASSHHPWNSVNIGPKRDIVGEFQNAARRNGLRFGVTSHDSVHWDWFKVAFDADKTGPKAGVPYDGRLTKADGKGKWWEGYDPADLYGPPPEVRTPELEKAMKENWLARHVELVDKYRPDLLYYDGGLTYEEYGQAVGSRLHNNSLRREGSIQTVLTIKHPEPGCVYDIERGGSEKLQERPWQTDTTFQDWFWKADEVPRHDARTLAECLVDIVSKNGNLLLNVELKPDGTYPEYHVGVMNRFAQWLKQNGEGIYETRPWKVFGDGPASQVVKGGKEHFNERTLESPRYDPNEVRFITKGKTLYVFVLNPKPGEVVVPSLGLNANTAPGRVTSVRLLEGSRRVKFSQSAENLVIQVPPSVTPGFPAAFKLTLVKHQVGNN